MAGMTEQPDRLPQTPDPKPDAWAGLAVDADALARAIREGRGDDVSRLVAELIDARAA